MFNRLRTRFARSQGDGGFTLIEVLVVVIIIGILLSIAVPTYVNFRNRANISAAQANLRSAIPSIEAYFADNGTYAGMTVTELRKIDPAIKVDVIGNANGSSYCIRNSEPTTVYYYKQGPNGAISTTACTGP